MPRSLLAAGALVAAAAVAATCNSVRNGFVWDDRAAILNNADVHGSGSLAELLTHDFWGKDLRSEDSHKSFRPLTVLSFRLNHQLAGFHPGAYLAANSAAHALCSLLVWVLARRLLGEQVERRQGIGQTHRSGGGDCGALLAGLLFAVHPVHCDAVASIVGRADLLCTMLSLSAVLVYMNAVQSARPGKSWLLFVAAVALAATSCVAKELGFTTFGILFVYELLQAANRQDKDSGRVWRWRLPLLVAIGSTLAVLRVYLNGEHRQVQWNILANSVAVHPDRAARLLSYAHIHAWYLWKLVWPRWLSFDYGFDTIPVITSVTDVRNCLTAVAYLAVLAGVGVAARQFYHATTTNQHHSPALIMSLALGIIPFVPASNIFFPVGTVVAERLLYLPSVGFCLLAALIVSSTLDTANKYASLPETPSKGASRRRWFRAASNVIVASCAFIVVTGCFRSRARNTEWESESKLFEASLRVTPTNVKVLSNTAKTLLHSDPDRALTYLRVAYGLAPGHPETLINIGVAFTTKEDRMSSIRYYAKALRDDPEHPSPPGFIGGGMIDLWRSANAGYSQEDYWGSPTIAKARELLDHSIFDCHSHFPAHYYNRGLLSYHAREFDKAIKFFNLTLKANAAIQERTLDPELFIDEAAVCNLIAACYLGAGDIELAAEQLEAGLVRFPLELDMRFNLALVRIQQQDAARASEQLTAAIHAATTSSHAIKLLEQATLLRRMDQPVAATAFENKAAELQA